MPQPLADLEPRRIEGGGLSFFCPHCRKTRIGVNPPRWTITGELPNISVHPSIDFAGHWHGHITNGQVIPQMWRSYGGVTQDGSAVLTGRIYICDAANATPRSNPPVGLLAWLPPPSPGNAPTCKIIGGLRPGDYFMQAEVPNEGVNVSGVVWATTGQKIDAQAATLLADTGSLAAGIFSTTFLIYTDTSDVMFSINRMNALNSAVVQQHQFSGFGYVFLLTVPMTLLLNERLTITVERAMIGKCQGSIFI